MIDLPVISNVSSFSPATLTDAEFLRHRMAKPQRHRLLHGYPLAAAMKRRDELHAKDDLFYSTAARRGLLVGVLPHPFCNPAVTGCGFCTFPHEPYHADQATEVVEHVIREIEGRVERQPQLQGRPVQALYIGGGTANLTPAAPFRRLCRALATHFDLSQAEVTLEGVPAYFVKRRPLLLEVLREEVAARQFRLSMGVQTFDENRLRQMGRLAFGDVQTFRDVVSLGRHLGYSTSADLLFNLPGQHRTDMIRDVNEANALGIDHVGLYHLVLFRGLGTAWSRDETMVAGLPSNEAAARNWISLREHMLSAGFTQTTLTNFERSELHRTDRRYLYEEYSFQSDRFEVLGFGPSALSFAADAHFWRGFKVLNPDSSREYVRAVQAGPAWDRYFDYGRPDLAVFYLTRCLAALSIDKDAYRHLLGHDIQARFGNEIEALQDAHLIEVHAGKLIPTPYGMFYADSIAALFARRQIHVRRNQHANDNGTGHM